MMLIPAIPGSIGKSFRPVQTLPFGLVSSSLSPARNVTAVERLPPVFERCRNEIVLEPWEDVMPEGVEIVR